MKIFQDKFMEISWETMSRVLDEEKTRYSQHKPIYKVVTNIHKHYVTIDDSILKIVDCYLIRERGTAEEFKNEYILLDYHDVQVGDVYKIEIPMFPRPSGFVNMRGDSYTKLVGLPKIDIIGNTIREDIKVFQIRIISKEELECLLLVENKKLISKTLMKYPSIITKVE